MRRRACVREINKRTCERERKEVCERESEIDVEFSGKRKSNVAGFGRAKKLSLSFEF
jgi:hypothetical protein